MRLSAWTLLADANRPESLALGEVRMLAEELQLALGGYRRSMV